MITLLLACTSPGDALPGDALPSFLLEDHNPTSVTFGQQVGPGDQAGLVSAWYFGHAT